MSERRCPEFPIEMFREKCPRFHAIGRVRWGIKPHLLWHSTLRSPLGDLSPGTKGSLLEILSNMGKNWYAIVHRNRTFKAERIQILERELKDETINKEGLEEYKKMKEVAEEVYKKCGISLPERVYHDYMVVKLQETYTSVIQEQRQPYMVDGNPCGSVIPDILASNENGDYVIEVKINKLNRGFLQLGQYVLNNPGRIGFLVGFSVCGVELYMMLSISESVCACYDGEKLYAMNLHPGRRG
jgi:hypothetical protein